MEPRVPNHLPASTVRITPVDEETVLTVCSRPQRPFQSYELQEAFDKYFERLRKDFDAPDQIAIPAGTPPGSYTIQVGLWLQAEGRRLSVKSGPDMTVSDSFEVGRVQVLR